jgi:hypothetical protein
MTKPPSRNAGYQGVTRDLVARDGQVCFLCGHKHATVHTLQADAKNRDKPFDLDNLIVACKPCAKRRNGKPIGAYWNERLSAAATEIAHINSVALNKEVIMSLREAYAPRITTPNAVGITGSTDEPKPEFDEDLAHLSRDQQREARAAPDYVPPSARPGYAPRITTPNAVDGTGSTMTEDQAKKLSEMIAAMNDDDDDDDDA